MGSAQSKAARAAGSAARKYPSRPSPHTNMPAGGPPPAAANRQPGPTVRPETQASETRDETINLDASDPDFARSLRSLGAVQPNPTLSPSSKFSQVLASKPSSRNPSSTTPTEPSPSPSRPTASSPTSPYANAEPIQSAGGPPVGPDPRSNPAIMVLQARQRWQDEADREFEGMGRKDYKGRSLVDVGTIRQALTLRDRRGMSEGKIEEMFELRKGTLGRLGPRGVVGVGVMGAD